MDRAGAALGGVLGVLIISVVFLLAVNQEKPATEAALLEDTPKDARMLQDAVTEPAGISEDARAPERVSPRTYLLTEIFEISESGVVRVNIERNGIITPNSVGSGFVYDMDGHIITNAHVVRDAGRIVVTFLDGRSYRAELVGTDVYTDIAVIRVEAAGSTLHPLVIGDSSTLRVGEPIAAIGNPFGLSGSMTSGIISQLGRLLPTTGQGFQIPDVIQTDAAINPGNSGGPLLNMQGEVIGINTAIQSATGEFTGVGFAVPSNTISKIVPVLIEDGRYGHPWLGISGRDIGPDLAGILNLTEARGFLVIDVVEESPAQKGGIHGSESSVIIDGRTYIVGGDIIVMVDDIEVRKIDDILIHLQRAKSVGDEIDLGVIRDGRSTTFTLILEERP